MNFYMGDGSRNVRFPYTVSVINLLRNRAIVYRFLGRNVQNDELF